MRLVDADALETVITQLNENGWEITRGEYKLIDNVLFEMPTIEPEPCKDAVKREDVQSIAEKSDWFESSDSFNDFIWALYELPSAHPEIIRCKDCMYWVAHDKRCVYLNHGFAPNMWCCHGRRTDEKENI